MEHVVIFLGYSCIYDMILYPSF